jgi:hypothetical protein
VHGARTARNQLLGLAQTNGIGRLLADCGMAEFTTRGSSRVSLDQAYFGLTAASVQYRAAIASALFISPKVVEKHVASIFDKLGPLRERQPPRHRRHQVPGVLILATC